MTDDRNDSFGFDGSWREFAPIAFTNLLLTIVTLGVYRFWATARERRYLWSHSRFIDDTLEWTGTGMELFFGFLLAMLFIGAPFLFLQFGLQALILRGHAEIAGVLGLISFIIIFYMVGVARFRAVRYRLSRTYWHGIRGGSEERGWMYGIIYMALSFAGYIPFGLLIPWSMMSLWNQRWNSMSFGPFAFRSEGRAGPLMKRFLLFYLLPFVFFIIFAVVIMGMIPLMGRIEEGAQPPAGIFALTFGMIVGLYVLIGLIALAFYAKFFRVAVSGLTLGDLEFRFTASTKEWLKLFLGDIGLVIVTLGIGYIFLAYRHWKFFITHLEATGEIDFNQLTQSTTPEPKQGEGLLDAFDVGAI